MLALPFVLHGLIVPELSTICSRIEQEGPDDINWDIEQPLDPVDHIFEFLLTSWTGSSQFELLSFQSNNSMLRLLWQSNLVETLKRVFAKRDGKELGWKMEKMP